MSFPNRFNPPTAYKSQSSQSSSIYGGGTFVSGSSTHSVGASVTTSSGMSIGGSGTVSQGGGQTSYSASVHGSIPFKGI
jgi:hypothetical protein